MMRNFLKDDDAIRVVLITVALVVAYFFIASPLGIFKALSLKASDTLCAVRYNLSSSRASEPIVITAIDDKSIEELKMKWPWPRSVYGELIGGIAELRPKVIAIDIVFAGETQQDLQQDIALAGQIRKAGNVVLSSYVSPGGELVLPNKMFAEAAAYVGIVNKPQRRDALVRSQQLVYYFPKEKAVDYSFELKAAARYLGFDANRIELKNNKVILKDKPFSPVLPINYKAHFRDFKLISASDILQKKVERADVEGRLVLLGQTSEMLHDVYLTPVGLMPGVAINANAVLGLLNNEELAPIPAALGFILLIVISAGIALALYYSSVMRGIIIFLASFFLSFLAAVYLYRKNIDVNYFNFIFGLTIGSSVPAVYSIVKLALQTERIRRLAITDELTGAATYRFFRFKLRSDFKEAEDRNRSLSVVLVVIRNAMSLYDEYGEEQYERALKTLGRLLKDNIRRGYFLGRYKEDGFGIILRGIPKDKAVEFVQTLQDIIAQSAQKIELKIGLASYPECRVSSSGELLLCAQQALSKTAKKGPPYIGMFEPLQDKLLGYIEDEAALKKKIDGVDYIGLDLEERNKELVAAIKELKEAHRETERAYFNSISSLVRALEEKDVYSAGHSERVGRYALLLAQKLNLPEEEIELIMEAAPLHDIGKIGVPDNILRKKGQLSDEEKEAMRRHQVEGAKILAPVKFFKDVVPLVLYHHERYDGKGYPHGLAGDMIPRGSQIIAIADTFDAMTTGRSYNVPLFVQDAKEELKKCAGTQFAPSYVKAFVELIDEGLTLDYK